MDRDKSLYVLAGYDPDTEAKISGWQQLLFDAGFQGEQTPCPPHITLFSAPTEVEAELKALVEGAAAETSPFSITFNHLGIFGGARVLFAAPDPNRELLTLREKFSSSENWTPHTTLLLDQPETIFRALPVAAQDFSAFCGRVEKLYLYEFFPERLICEVALKG